MARTQCLETLHRLSSYRREKAEERGAARARLCRWGKVGGDGRSSGPKTRDWGLGAGDRGGGSSPRRGCVRREWAGAKNVAVPCFSLYTGFTIPIQQMRAFMATEVTGPWEELVSRPEFRGHKVRVTIVGSTAGSDGKRRLARTSTRWRTAAYGPPDRPMTAAKASTRGPNDPGGCQRPAAVDPDRPSASAAVARGIGVAARSRPRTIGKLPADALRMYAVCTRPVDAPNPGLGLSACCCPDAGGGRRASVRSGNRTANSPFPLEGTGRQIRRYGEVHPQRSFGRPDGRAKHSQAPDLQRCPLCSLYRDRRSESIRCSGPHEPDARNRHPTFGSRSHSGRVLREWAGGWGFFPNSEFISPSPFRPPPSPLLLPLCRKRPDKIRYGFPTRWCNGNTRDFGSLVQGSNPCRVAWWVSSSPRSFDAPPTPLTPAGIIITLLGSLPRTVRGGRATRS